ncbi:MAG: hypothetical protein QOI95_93 [Acidimicrobiaceae bacterium]|jgi:hypothetical protein
MSAANPISHSRELRSTHDCEISTAIGTPVGTPVYVVEIDDPRRYTGCRFPFGKPADAG